MPVRYVAITIHLSQPRSAARPNVKGYSEEMLEQYKYGDVKVLKKG
jgi:hypothetical protein